MLAQQAKSNAPIEEERQRLLSSKENIEVRDFGAGSAVSPLRQRQVGSMAHSGLMPARWAARLQRLLRHTQAQHVWELGSSFGITTAYLASSGAQVTTFEGCPSSANVARQVWQNLGVGESITLIEGDLSETLFAFLEKKPIAPDIVVLDANHRSEAIVGYFEKILPHLKPDTIVVVDDLYWSADMAKGWQALKAHSRVRQSLDLYRQGYLFFRPNQAKEHRTVGVFW